MVFRSAAIPFDFHLSFAFELVDKPIHLLAIKADDLALSGSSGSRLIRARERQNTKSKDPTPIFFRLNNIPVSLLCNVSI